MVYWWKQINDKLIFWLTLTKKSVKSWVWVMLLPQAPEHNWSVLKLLALQMYKISHFHFLPIWAGKKKALKYQAFKNKPDSNKATLLQDYHVSNDMTMVMVDGNHLYWTPCQWTASTDKATDKNQECQTSTQAEINKTMTIMMIMTMRMVLMNT